MSDELRRALEHAGTFADNAWHSFFQQAGRNIAAAIRALKGSSGLPPAKLL